jgi:hypothetical protein
MHTKQEWETRHRTGHVILRGARVHPTVLCPGLDTARRNEDGAAQAVLVVTSVNISMTDDLAIAGAVERLKVGPDDFRKIQVEEGTPKILPALGRSASQSVCQSRVAHRVADEPRCHTNGEPAPRKRLRGLMPDIRDGILATGIPAKRVQTAIASRRYDGIAGAKLTRVDPAGAIVVALPSKNSPV